MSEDSKTEEAVEHKAEASKDDTMTEAELNTVTGGAKPWLDKDREPDTAIFTVERL